MCTEMVRVTNRIDGNIVLTDYYLCYTSQDLLNGNLVEDKKMTSKMFKGILREGWYEYTLNDVNTIKSTQLKKLLLCGKYEKVVNVKLYTND